MAGGRTSLIYTRIPMQQMVIFKKEIHLRVSHIFLPTVSVIFFSDLVEGHFHT